MFLDIALTSVAAAADLACDHEQCMLHLAGVLNAATAGIELAAAGSYRKVSTARRTGNIFAGGALSTVDLKVGGTGMVVLSGANKVTGQVDGTSNVYVDTPSGEQG